MVRTDLQRRIRKRRAKGVPAAASFCPHGGRRGICGGTGGACWDRDFDAEAIKSASGMSGAAKPPRTLF